ncbi:hypothetical protein [Streptomyces sp. L2]|uniref:hypothetical protein n=1 Tax=Streptomyces sp. L2 TaxID=2162665 RepID=UPI0010127530|nr:hypothetical protein [Streptomyces sp. L2]
MSSNRPPLKAAEPANDWPQAASPSNVLDIPIRNGVYVVTPAMAKSWLEHRNLERNRRYSSTIEAKYAAEMRAGLWKTTHQGIAFDHDGFLLDGQHRLGAIVRLNQPIQLDIRVDCDPDTFDVLDTGHKRTAHQMLGSQAHAKVVSAAARFLGALDGTIRTGHIRSGVFAVSPSSAEVLAVVEAWPELGTHAASAVFCRSKGQILAAPHLAVLSQAARTRYADKIPMWLDGLAYGENLTGADPRLHLRNRMASERAALNRQQPTAYTLIVKAWNAHAQGASMGVLRVRAEEAIPSVIA